MLFCESKKIFSGLRALAQTAESPKIAIFSKIAKISRKMPFLKEKKAKKWVIKNDPMVILRDFAGFFIVASIPLGKGNQLLH